MADLPDLEEAITTAEGEAAIHDLVENGIFGLNAVAPSFFGLTAPEGHVLVMMTVGQKVGLIECSARLRRAVDEVSRAFYATDGARDHRRPT